MRYIVHNHFPRALDSGLDDEFASALKQARAIDPLGYFPGLKRLTLTPDTDKWNAAYSPDKDEIEIQAKFHKKTFTDKVQTLLHEVGHRGQFTADPETFKAFIKAGLNQLGFFLAMANEVHQADYKKAGIDKKDLADEVFAESYARFALGLPMPAELKSFWATRGSARDARRPYDPAHREYTGREPVASAIKNHPGVQEVEISQDSDYKYEVFLKEGWCFEKGRTAGIRTGFFQNVSDFRHANPVRRESER